MHRARSIIGQLLPGITSMARGGSAGRIVLIGAAIVASIVIMTILSPWLSPHDPTAINVGPVSSPPSSRFPLGTNHLGQDMLSRVISGGGVMLKVALLSAFFCLIVGVPVGLVASYSGGVIDKAVSLVMDSFYAFPGLVLAIAIADVGAGEVGGPAGLALVEAAVPHQLLIGDGDGGAVGG